MASKLEIDRGCSYTLGILFKKDDVPTSLVGATVRFTVKTEEFSSSTTDADAVILKDITDGTAGGEATIEITPDDTDTLTPGIYYYDIKVDVSSDATEVYKLDEGTIVLDGSPTNRLA